MHVLVLVAVVVLIIYLLTRNADLPISDYRNSEEELTKICLGDSGKVERLIQLELDNAPRISRDEAAKRAVRSIRRDLK